LRDETFARLAQRKIVVHTLGFGSGIDARNLQDIAARTGGTFRSVSIADAAPTLYLATEEQLLAALRGSDSKQRATAVEVIAGRELPCIGDMVELLRDPDRSIRQTAHNSLVQLAGGSDFGPAEGDDEAESVQAVVRWNLWLKWRKEKGQVGVKLASNDPDECWVATALARQRGLELPKELIGVLGHPRVHVRREARAALVQLAGDLDFGPDADADAEHVAEAIAR
jgi:hypothetical protein